jgi:hypothetical protein
LHIKPLNRDAHDHCPFAIKKGTATRN